MMGYLKEITDIQKAAFEISEYYQSWEDSLNNVGESLLQLDRLFNLTNQGMRPDLT